MRLQWAVIASCNTRTSQLPCRRRLSGAFISSVVGALKCNNNCSWPFVQIEARAPLADEIRALSGAPHWRILKPH